MNLHATPPHRCTRQKIDRVRPDCAIVLRRLIGACFIALPLCASGLSAAAPLELGRLFYTPDQRSQLEFARTHRITERAQPNKQNAPIATPAPLRYDGVLIRSDGNTTRWVDGKAQVGPSSVPGLKPGQIRAYGKVYEPYQVLRTPPSPAGTETRATAP